MQIRPNLDRLYADLSGTVYQCVSTESDKRVRLQDLSRTSWLSSKTFLADLHWFDNYIVDVTEDFGLPLLGGKSRSVRPCDILQAQVDGAVHAVQIDSLYYDWNARKAVFGISLLNSLGCGQRVLKAFFLRHVEHFILTMSKSSFAFKGQSVWQMIEANET